MNEKDAYERFHSLFEKWRRVKKIDEPYDNKLLLFSEFERWLRQIGESDCLIFSRTGSSARKPQRWFKKYFDQKYC